MAHPINFEIAKLLKEKGFDKTCYRAFLFRRYQPSNIYEENIEAIINAERYSNSEYVKYYRPTIEEVVTWLYEKHMIWVVVSLNQFSKPKDLQWMYSIIYATDCTYSHSPTFYNSPIEAYETSLEYILQNLI